MRLKIILASALAFGLGFLAGYHSGPIRTVAGKVSFLTRTDTITIHQPIAVSTRPHTRIQVRLPTADSDSDSVAVTVPLESKIYESPDFRAYVSGYRASLDSISLRRQFTVTTASTPTPRWSIGIQAGYGITPRGFQPYIGLGIQYRFLAF